jgi:hypothetical protein
MEDKDIVFLRNPGGFSAGDWFTIDGCYTHKVQHRMWYSRLHRIWYRFANRLTNGRYRKHLLQKFMVVVADEDELCSWMLPSSYEKLCRDLRKLGASAYASRPRVKEYQLLQWR